MKKISVVLLSLLMAACASSPGNVAPIQSIDSKTNAGSGVSTAGLTAEQLESKRLADEALANGGLAAQGAQSVYFDLNEFTVKAEYQNVIQKQADYPKSHRGEALTLQGNSDERGSNEFNLALGDRRAIAVKKSLEAMGVADQQINIVSFGEEKPRLTCHEERCWSDNRRVDFIYKAGR
jgi:peptidoglycan-associated lipoprotein